MAEIAATLTRPGLPWSAERVSYTLPLVYVRPWGLVSGESVRENISKKYPFLTDLACIGLLPTMRWFGNIGDNGSSHPGGAGIDRFETIRLRMVEDQIRRRDVKDPRVLRAMEAVPRHRFVLPEDEPYAYNDNPLPIGYGQTISQPYIVALMTELLELEPTHRVLEIGTGSGYQAAVLSRVAGEVYTIEYVEQLGSSAKRRLRSLGYDNVQVRIGDGYNGWPEAAPFDAVIVTAAPERVPRMLVSQLTDGGRMAIPVGTHFQELYCMIKEGDDVTKEKVANVRFVPMVGGDVD